MPDAIARLASRISDDSQLEQYISTFEDSALHQGSSLKAEFLPPQDHPDRLAIATELVRVDLELSWQRGQKRLLDDYRQLVPELFSSPPHLAAAAFEESRLRQNAGKQLDSETYFEGLGSPSDQWPAAVAGEDPASALEQVDNTYPKPGELFDGLHLEHVIGVGVSSRVYLARQPQFGNRLVALKVSATTTIESNYLGRLQHTNIVPVYSCHFDHGLCGLCMPFLGVATLADLLQSSGELSLEASWQRTCQLAAQLADGLQHAHESNVVHADIKPANVLIGDDGIPRLLDFHLASEVSREGIPVEVVGGTIPYMAPEHLDALRSGSSVGRASDIFSLGALVFEMLTGRLPFPQRLGVFDEVCCRAIDDRQAGPPSARSLKRDIPVGLDAIVRKCLAPHPRDRYQSASQIAADLRNELASAPLIHTTEPSLLSRMGKWQRLHRRTMIKAVVALLLLSSLVLLAIWRQREIDLADSRALGQFTKSVEEARAALAIQHRDADLVNLGTESIEAALRALGISMGQPWAQSQVLQRLDAEEQQQAMTALSEIKHLATSAGLEIEPLRQFEAVQLASDAPEPVSVAAHKLIGDDRFADAAMLLEKQIETSRSDMVLWTQLSVCQLAQGLIAEALASQTAAIALAPKSSIPWRYRGYARLEAGEQELALADFEHALSISPQSHGLQLNRAIALYELKRLEEAERAASLALDAGVDRPRAWLLRAKIRTALGDASEADEDLRRAYASKPIDDQDWAALAIAAAKVDPQGAYEIIERGLDAFPKSILLLRNKVHLLGDVLRQPSDALDAVEAILAVRPDDVPAQLSRAVILVKQGSDAEAIAACDRVNAEQLRPVDHLQIACVHALSAGESEDGTAKALDHLRRAIAADPRLADRAAKDPDLRSLHDQRSFRQTLAAAATLLGSTSSGEQ